MKIFLLSVSLLALILSSCRTRSDEQSEDLFPDDESNTLSLNAKACSESIGKSILNDGGEKTLDRPNTANTKDLQLDAFRIETTTMENSYPFMSVGVSAKNQTMAQYFEACICSLEKCDASKRCFALKSHHLLPPLGEFDGKQVKISLSACTDQVDTYEPLCGEPISQTMQWRPRLRAINGLSKIDKQYQTYLYRMQDIDQEAFLMWRDSCRLVNAKLEPKNSLEEVYFNAAKNVCYSSSAFVASVLAFDFLNFVELGQEEQPWLGSSKQLDQCHTQFQGLSLTSDEEKQLPTSLRIGFPTLAIGLSVYVLGYYFGTQGWRGLASYTGFEVGGRLGSELGWRLGGHVLGWPGAFIGSFTGAIGGSLTGGFVGGRVGMPLYRRQFRRTRDTLIREGILTKKSQTLEAPKVDLSDANPEQQKVLARMNRNNEVVGRPLRKYGGWSAFIGLIATSVGIIQIFSLTDSPSIADYMARLSAFDKSINQLVEQKNLALTQLVGSFP
ncbi:MAG: hypothetical protein HRU09_07095 [Oligoflexales bacterium]|nr:hypothetical protein [Oligoflexales bacterium]